MAKNAINAVVRVGSAAMSGESVLVSQAVYDARMVVCSACPKVMPIHKHGQTWHRCTLCGCWLDGKHVAKARLATETCPESRWHE